jgi:hypothetical protein
MLKRYITEMGGFLDSKNNMEKTAVPQNPIKIAAPKPVRARPVAFANYSLPKWIQTSPVKSEMSEDVSETRVPNET